MGIERRTARDRAGGLSRLRILALLQRDGPAHLTELARRLGLATSTAWYHIRLLHESGLISRDPLTRMWEARIGGSDSPLRGA